MCVDLVFRCVVTWSSSADVNDNLPTFMHTPLKVASEEHKCLSPQGIRVPDVHSLKRFDPRIEGDDWHIFSEGDLFAFSPVDK